MFVLLTLHARSQLIKLIMHILMPDNHAHTELTCRSVDQLGTCQVASSWLAHPLGIFQSHPGLLHSGKRQQS